MIRCPDCGAAQHEGVLYCEECGRFLVSDQETAVLPFSQMSTSHLTTPLTTNNLSPTESGFNITIVMPHNRQRITATITNTYRIGRSDYETQHRPELDLTDHDGIDLGVSRNHAVIHTAGERLVLQDLDSTNGTWLNNQRLAPKRYYPLKSGDEIRFGDLLIHLFVDEALPSR